MSKRWTWYPLVPARDRSAVALGAAAVALTAYWVGCKLLLFRNLEYYGSDFFSCLEMSRSWLHTGILLWDPVYEAGGAIHNNYLLLLFSPLTEPLGGYGLILGVSLLLLLAGLRTVSDRSLTVGARVALLAALLSPVGFWVYDNPMWGFHVEMCYAPLGLLLALAVLEGRIGQAVLWGLLTVAVKEDGPLVCAAVLIVCFAARLVGSWGEADRRRRELLVAASALAGCAVLFLAGVGLLHLQSRAAETGQLTSDARLAEALSTTIYTMRGWGAPGWAERLHSGLSFYLVVAVAYGLLAPRRLPRFLGLVALGCPPLLPTLVVSSAPYGFGTMLWPPRVVELLALLLAAAAAVARDGPEPARSERERWLRRAGWVAALVGSWAIQLTLLMLVVGYSPFPRLNLPALLDGRDSRRGELSAEELRFTECLATRVPFRTGVLSLGPQTPLFHRRALVFPVANDLAREAALVLTYREPAVGRTAHREGAPPGWIVVGRLEAHADPPLAGAVDVCAELAP